MLVFGGCLFIGISGFSLSGCVNQHKATAHDIGGCVHDQKLPPLSLSHEQKELLASVSKPPKTALDYYMLLPKSYFSILENDPGRRISFVKLKTLSKDHIQASHWFECDGGGFEVTIHVYHNSNGDLIGLNASEDSHASGHVFKDANQKHPFVEVLRPTFWTYQNDTWKHVNDSILPIITESEVLHDYYASFQKKYGDPASEYAIDLAYCFEPETAVILLRGRERYMDPFHVYTWKKYRWNGKKFLLTPTTPLAKKVET